MVIWTENLRVATVSRSPRMLQGRRPQWRAWLGLMIWILLCLNRLWRVGKRRKRTLADGMRRMTLV